MTIILLFLMLALPATAQDTSKVNLNLEKLERTYKSQIITGSLELGAGTGLVIAGLYFREKVICKSQGSINGVPFGTECKPQTKAARISFFCGAVFTGIGIYSVVKGAKNRQKYIKLTGSPNSASLNITF